MIHIHTKEEFKKITNRDDDQLVVVKYGAKWCGPCRIIQPQYEQLSKLYDDCIFCHLDIDEVESKDVKSIPTFKVFRRGKLVEQYVASSIVKIQTIIENNLPATGTESINKIEN